VIMARKNDKIASYGHFIRPLADISEFHTLSMRCVYVSPVGIIYAPVSDVPIFGQHRGDRCAEPIYPFDVP